MKRGAQIYTRLIIMFSLLIFISSASAAVTGQLSLGNDCSVTGWIGTDNCYDASSPLVNFDNEANSQFAQVPCPQGNCVNRPLSDYVTSQACGRYDVNYPIRSIGAYNPEFLTAGAHTIYFYGWSGAWEVQSAPGSPMSYTIAIEICDSIDNDCDGQIDEGGVCCPNGVLNSGEQCDDGNTDQSDSCRNDCRPNICGDTYKNTGVEQCDDGNTQNGDGCDSDCNTEECGNGINQTPEQCDDGNTDQTDSCKNDCTNNICGDGFAYTGVEQCDDGNLLNGDSCDSLCNLGTCQSDGDCGDGSACSVDSCVGGLCQYNYTACECSTPSDCNDNNPCTNNTCSSGVCATINNSAICNDDNNCTDNDICSLGSCSGTAKPLDDGNVLTIDTCLINGTVTHITSFNLTAHLESQEDASEYDTYTTYDEPDQTFNSSSDDPDPSSAASPGQDSEDNNKINPVLLVSIVLIVLILIGLAIFVLPGLINKKNNPSQSSDSKQVPPRGPPSGPPRGPPGMPPRRPQMRMPPRR